MESSPSPNCDDEHLEQKLLGQMQAAERRYRAAAAEYRRIKAEYGAMLDHPDGIYSVRHGARKEREALSRYLRILKAFSDMVLQRRRPSTSDPD
jgi:hypothetical protein